MWDRLPPNGKDRSLNEGVWSFRIFDRRIDLHQEPFAYNPFMNTCFVKMCFKTQHGTLNVVGQYRCTFSYPNRVFVFMASVNYISRCHGSFLNYVTCHDLYWGHWRETMPWMPFIWSNWFSVVAHLEPKSWYHQPPSHLPWDHLHLNISNRWIWKHRKPEISNLHDI